MGTRQVTNITEHKLYSIIYVNINFFHMVHVSLPYSVSQILITLQNLISPITFVTRHEKTRLICTKYTYSMYVHYCLCMIFEICKLPT